MSRAPNSIPSASPHSGVAAPARDRDLPTAAAGLDGAVPSWPRHAARIAALFAIVAAVLALIGWEAGIRRLTDWRNDGISTFPNTAIAVILCGAALFMRPAVGGAAARARATLGALTAVIAGLTLLQHVLGVDLGIDALLFEQRWTSVAAAAPMRMGPPASTALLLVGVAALLATRGVRARAISAALGVATIAIAALSLTGYLYGAEQMYILPRLTGIALPTSTMLLALGVATVLSVPAQEPMRMILDPGAAGLLVRRTLPAILLVAFTLGWVRVQLQLRGYVDTAFGTALRTLAEIALLTTLLGWASRTVRAHEAARRRSERDVGRTAEQLAALLETAAIGIQRIAADGTVLWINDAGLELLGYDRDDVVGQPFAALHVDPEAARGMLARLERGEPIAEHEVLLRAKDGATRSVLIDAGVSFEDGRFAYAQCFLRDVTERKIAGETRARLAAIVETSDDAIISKTLDGIILTWNDGARRLFGYTAEEMIGQSIRKLAPPERPDDSMQILERIRAGERVEHYETERVRKDGQRLQISLTVSPIRDARGTIIGASKIARDVTARRRAEETLRQTLDVLARLNRSAIALSSQLDMTKLVQTVTEIASEAIGARDAAFVFDREANRAIDAADPLPDASYLAFADLDLPYLTELRTATLRGDGVIRIDDLRVAPSAAPIASQHGEGTARAAVASYLAVPVVLRGTVLGGLFFGHPEPGRFSERDERFVAGLAGQAAIAIDNARLYQAEQRARADAESANRAKDELLSVVSHEMRTPLAAILGWTAVLRRGTLPPERIPQALDAIERSGRVQAELIEDLLDVSRMVTGRLALDREQIELRLVVEAALDAIRPDASAKGVRLESVLQDGLLVHGDTIRLQQVFSNVLGNALKFTPAERAIHVTIDRVAADLARVTVRDEGEGIDPRFLPHAFEPFRQADDVRKRTGGGLGLGLTIVKSLVEQHGGTVSVASDGPGCGTTVRIVLPLVVTSQTDPPSDEPARAASARL